jgi:hypothetical protein
VGTFLLSHWSSSSGLLGAPVRTHTALTVLPALVSHSSHCCDELCTPANHRAGSSELAVHKRCCIPSTKMHSLQQGAAIEQQLILLSSPSARIVALRAVVCRHNSRHGPLITNPAHTTTQLARLLSSALLTWLAVHSTHFQTSVQV